MDSHQPKRVDITELVIRLSDGSEHTIVTGGPMEWQLDLSTPFEKRFDERGFVKVVPATERFKELRLVVTGPVASTQFTGPESGANALSVRRLSRR